MSDTKRIVPSPRDPLQVARRLLTDCYTSPDQRWLLRTHRGDFFRYTGTHYVELETRDVRSQAYRYLEHAVFEHPEDGLVPFAPTQRKMHDLLDALAALALIPSASEPPCWIDDSVPSVAMTAMANGLLDVTSRTLHPHSPAFFTRHALPFPFDPHATQAPRWEQFLADLWPHDLDARRTLQEIFGYALVGDTRQQKAFLLIGPKRSGKGTIARVLTGLLGAHHVAAPTLASLAQNFGLSPLIGKPLAIVSDARLSSRADSAIVVERLLSISGEDGMTIDRKYRDPWTGRLPTRFLILSNELPRLSDASGALASRFVLLLLDRSFYGHENLNLTTELLDEAPAIFNWALEGFDRLQDRGYFETPMSGTAAVRQLEDLSSPIGAFLRDSCVVKPELQVSRPAIWAAWKAWCQEANVKPSSIAVFGRDLHARIPGLRVTRPVSDKGTTREYVYEGLTLREENSPKLPGLPGPDGPTPALTDASGPSSPSSPSNSALYSPRPDPWADLPQPPGHAEAVAAVEAKLAERVAKTTKSTPGSRQRTGA